MDHLHHHCQHFHQIHFLDFLSHNFHKILYFEFQNYNIYIMDKFLNIHFHFLYSHNIKETHILELIKLLYFLKLIIFENYKKSFSFLYFLYDYLDLFILV